MRVLVVGLFPTHLMPMIPLMWALRAQGHEVLVSGNAGVVDRAKLAGLSGAVVLDPPPQAPSRAAAARRPGATSGELDWDVMAARWRVRVDSVVDAHLHIARGWRPDLILCDPIEFSGLVVAGALDVPVVVHRWGADRISSQSIPRAARALAEIGELRGLRGGVPTPALVIDPCPPTLQCPDAAPAQTVRFVPFNGAGTVPDWLSGTRPARRLAVSFGSETAMLADRDRWDAMVGALDSIDGLESVFTSTAPDGGAVPASIRTAGPVPLDLFLPGCDALLHHGGSGTCLTGLSLGLPQIVYRQQHPSYAAHAERIEACGAGRALDLSDADRDPAALRSAVLDVLTDPRYRAVAESLRAEMADQPTPGDLVPLLTDLARVPVGR